MLYVPNGGNDFAVTASYSSSRPGVTNLGTSVTPSIVDSYSAFSPVGGPLQRDSYGMYINVNNYFAGATFRQLALRFNVDYTGSTNFASGNTVVEGLIGSQAITYGLGGGVWYYFPIYMPSGSRLGVAGRGSANTAPLPSIFVRFMTATPNPSIVKRASYAYPLGLTTGSGTVTGVSVTPGTTAKGAWTEIGTTNRRTWWWQVGSQHSDTTMTALNYHIDVGVGPDLNNVDTIISDQYVETSATEQFNNIPVMLGAEKVVPSGSKIWARIQNAGTNENAGSYQVVVYACGG